MDLMRLKLNRHLQGVEDVLHTPRDLGPDAVARKQHNPLLLTIAQPCDQSKRPHKLIIMMIGQGISVGSVNSHQSLYRRTAGTRNAVVQPIPLAQFLHFGWGDLGFPVIEQRGGSFVQIFGGEEILIAQFDELIIGHIRLIFLLFFGVIWKVTAIFINPFIEPIQNSYSLLAVLQLFLDLAGAYYYACCLVLEVRDGSGGSAFVEQGFGGGQPAIFLVELAAGPSLFCWIGELDVVGVQDVVQDGGSFSFYLESSVDRIVIGLLQGRDEAFWFGVVAFAEEGGVGFVGIEMDLKFCQVLLHRSSTHNKSNRNM